MSEFHFLRPLMLLALLLLPLLFMLVRSRHSVRGAWTRIIDPRLQPYVLTNSAQLNKRDWSWLWYLIAALLIVALAGPVWEKLPQPVFVKQQPLVIALDLSQSMNAQDVLPSRLELAKIKLQDILARRQDGQAALLVFAGDAFVVTPMTDDAQTIISLLSSLSTGMMPVQGSRLAPALAMADQLLRQSSSPNGQVLLLTDGVNDVDAATNAASSLASRGHEVAVLAMGTEQGDVIRNDAGEFIKDAGGNIVIARVTREALQSVASAGNGAYTASRADDSDIDALLQAGPQGFGGATSRDDLTTDLWREQGPLILLLCLPFIAYAFRSGVLLSLLLLMLIPWQPVYAGTLNDLWSDLWNRADQQAQKKFAAGDFDQAAALYKDPQHKAAALYRAEQYAESGALLLGVDEPDAHYNRGNALAHAGELEGAIAAYERALALDATHDDARHNLEVLRQMQQEQEQQSQSEDNQQEQQNQDENEQQQSDAGNEDSEEQNDENSEAQNDEQQAREDEQNPTEQQQAQVTEEMTDEEKQQAIEQWLRRVPDDPGGLLRRKFRRQYRERGNRLPQTQEEW